MKETTELYECKSLVAILPIYQNSFIFSPLISVEQHIELSLEIQAEISLIVLGAELRYYLFPGCLSCL